jgi:hypothetical protein
MILVGVPPPNNLDRHSGPAPKNTPKLTGAKH